MNRATRDKLVAAIRLLRQHKITTAADHERLKRAVLVASMNLEFKR